MELAKDQRVAVSCCQRSRPRNSGSNREKLLAQKADREFCLGFHLMPALEHRQIRTRL